MAGEDCAAAVPLEADHLPIAHRVEHDTTRRIERDAVRADQVDDAARDMCLLTADADRISPGEPALIQKHGDRVVGGIPLSDHVVWNVAEDQEATVTHPHRSFGEAKTG